MVDAKKARSRSRLFVGMGCVAALVALTGFAKTFFYPLLAGTFRAHPMIYVHGIFLFGWVAFFLLQALLAYRGKIARHRSLGWIGGILAVGVVGSTIFVATLAGRRVAASGAVDVAQGELFVVMLEMLVFAGLILAALWFRRRPDLHKRLMLLALIGSLGPAWFRFRHYFPAVDNPLFLYSVLLADSLIVIAILSDMIRYGRPHPVYVAGGGAMILLHLSEVFGFDTPLFRAMAEAAAAPLIG
jgi:hypothetical protein